MDFDALVNAAALKASGMVLGGLQSGGAVGDEVYRKLMADAKAIDKQLPPSKEDLLEIKKALLESAKGFEPVESKKPAFVTKHMTDLMKLFKTVSSASGKSKEALESILDSELNKLSNNDIYFFLYSALANNNDEISMFAKKILAMNIDFKKVEKEVKEEQKSIPSEEKGQGAGRGRKKKAQ